MKLAIQLAPPEKHAQSCLIVGVYEDNELTVTAEKIDRQTKKSISALFKQGLMLGKLGQIFTLVNTASFSHIILVGFGKKDQVTLQGFRKAVSTMGAVLRAQKIKTAVCYLAEIAVKAADLSQKIRQIAEGMEEGCYQFDIFKSVKNGENPVKNVIVAIDDKKFLKAAALALQQGEAIANGMTFTKNLGNLPSNVCTPTFLAEQAKDLGKHYRSIAVKVLEEKDMQKLNMGAILAVSQGSAEDAKLICLEYRGGSKKAAPVALIGKGVTFDTGGNSIKPADAMVGMKYDMCGAATVLGVFKAVAELELPINLVGLIPTVENMPGGTGYKPEDILTSMSGQTIEVISTDAEGRLILADALTYCERYKPAVVIDIATLTGAVLIALGFHATGLVANDDALANDLLKAGIESNDRAWQLPLWEEYQEQIKSPFADMANTGGRTAGVITAGCFLSRFAKTFRWAHLDVAGTAAIMMGTNERMATGRPVPLLMQYLIDQVGAHES